MKLSILTATYNRDEYLPRLYESIKNNMIDDLEIEWVIIDDESTDKTMETITSFMKVRWRQLIKQ